MSDKPAKKPARKSAPAADPPGGPPGGPVLLAGGNPQIPKGYGEATVRAWIEAAPGWKGEVAARIDALITRTVPGVRKAVKWNSPLYGAGDEGWFLSLHCMTKYVKVAFLKGQALDPVPPEPSKHPEVRYFHIREGEAFDEAQFTAWVEQASRLPGEKM